MRKHRFSKAPLTLAAALCTGFTAGIASAQMDAAEAAVIQQFAKEMAEEHDFDQQQVMEALTKAAYRQEIIDAITTPAEALPWHRYRGIFLTEQRIEEGLAFWSAHAETLNKAAERFGVPPEIIVAIIGVESRYGEHRGGHRVIDALRTLAFDYAPRSDFFRRELEEYFLLTREEDIDPLQPRGSYAGAVGVPQFISSSYRAYAVDFNDNGQRDLWDEIPDAIGSVANYFRRHDWKPGAPIMDPVTVDGQAWEKFLGRKLKPRHTVAELRANGVQVPEGVDGERRVKLLELEGDDGAEYYATYHNFYVITRYNHSPLYAMAVYQLSQAIAERRKAQ